MPRSRESRRAVSGPSIRRRVHSPSAATRTIVVSVTAVRGSGRADVTHLEQFVATRRGVEGYVEPRTAVTETTIVLVAADGEWTRRRIDGPDTARRLSRELGIPVYDAQVTGYPQRMRDWKKDPPPPTAR
jgi:hypothetical protein